MSTRRFWLTTGLLLGIFAGPAIAQLKGYDDSLTDSLPAVLIDIDPATGIGSIPPEFAGCPAAPNPPNTVFTVGFTSGYAFMGNTLYGLEFDPVTGTDIYLYAMAASFCAEGARVGATPVGFEILESLAYCPTDGFLYSVDFDFAAHQGELIRIDPATGVGAAVGDHMARDVWVVGLAWDPDSGQLLGVTRGYADRNIQELYTIDRNSGKETLVGPTGTDPEELQSLTLDTSMVPARLLAAGTRLYQLDRSTGTATPIGGNYNGTVWALAVRLSGSPPTATPTTATPATPTEVQTPLATMTVTATGLATATSTRTPPTIPMASPTATPGGTTPTRSQTPTTGGCAGDCDGSGDVSIAELVRGVSITLGRLLLNQCPQMDANGDGFVTIDELVRAVNAALHGCAPN